MSIYIAQPLFQAVSLVDFVTLRRELGGGWIHQENDDDAFEVNLSMTGVVNEMNEVIDELEKEVMDELDTEEEENK